MGVLDTSHLDDVPPMYGVQEVEALADHFRMDVDDVITEWSGLCDVLATLPRDERSLDRTYQLLCGERHRQLGLNEAYPLVSRLYAISLTVPMSTAEVERIFSQLALIKTDHRNRLSQRTLQCLLSLKVNMRRVDMQSVVDRAAVAWLALKERRLCKTE